MDRLRCADLSRDLAALFAVGTLADLGDGQLLDRFLSQRDEPAIAELIARHGPRVLAICRRSLDDPHDIEDAFQATFLVLARKARSLRDRDALSSWLHGVALRVARRARKDALRRHLREGPMTVEPASPAPAHHECLGREVSAIVEEEVGRLPRDQQVAVIRCLLEGRTHESAASELGWPLGTVKSRIAAARQTLTRRLARRGLTPSGIAAIFRIGEPSSRISAHLVRLTAQAAVRSLADPSPLAATMPASVAGLVRGVARTMLITRIRTAGLLVMTLTSLAWAAPALLSARPGGPAGQIPARSDAPVPTGRPPRTDRYGDPLPPGAVMRLGSVRFRHDRIINHIAYTPDGRLLVTDDRGRFFQIWDAKTGLKLRRIDSGLQAIRHFALSPDGRTIVAVSNQSDPMREIPTHRMIFTELDTGRQIRQAEWDAGNDRLHRVYYAPDGKAVVTVTHQAGFQVWDITAMRIVYREPSGVNADVAVAASLAADGHLLAIARAGIIRLFDTEHLRDVRTIADDRYRAADVELAPDGTAVVARMQRPESDDVELRLFRVSDGARLGRFSSAKTKNLYAMTFSPDGKVLAAIGDQDQVISFDVATGRELDILPAARAAALPLVFSPDGSTFTTIAGEQTLHFWDRATGRDRLATPDAHQDSVQSIAFIDAGKTLVSSGRDQTVRLWDLATGRPSKVLRHDGNSRLIAVRADGSLLAGGLVSRIDPAAGMISTTEARIWDLSTGATLYTWSIAVEDNTAFADVWISRVDSRAIATFKDGSLRTWDLATGAERPVIRPKLPKVDDQGFVGEFEVDQSFFAPDGRSAALTNLQGSIVVIDVPGGGVRFKTSAMIRDPNSQDHISLRTSVKFAPDGQSLAFVRQFYKEIEVPGGENRFEWPRESTIVWLDGRTGTPRREILIPESNVGVLGFAPDGRSLAVATRSHDQGSIIRIIRLADKKEVQTIETPSPITAFAFTPDGGRVAAGLVDTSIVLWDVRRPD